jgi:hypothetical protein
MVPCNLSIRISTPATFLKDQISNPVTGLVEGGFIIPTKAIVTAFEEVAVEAKVIMELATPHGIEPRVFVAVHEVPVIDESKANMRESPDRSPFERVREIPMSQD